MSRAIAIAPRALASAREIPQCGRIVALADVFDALMHARPYNEAWSVERAVEEVHRLREVQFDLDVVDAFGELDGQDIASRSDLERADDVEAAA